MRWKITRDNGYYRFMDTALMIERRNKDCQIGWLCDAVKLPLYIIICEISNVFSRFSKHWLIVNH